MDKENVRLVHETLLMLTDSSPTDAYLVKMQMEGLSYQQMAEKMLGNKPKSDKELKKKTDPSKTVYSQYDRLHGEVQELFGADYAKESINPYGYAQLSHG
jgi:hypothetical protein